MNDHAHPAHHREPAVRGAVIIGLMGIGLIHVIDSVGKYSETRYLFWMYIALILGCLAVGAFLLHTGSRLAYAAAAGLSLTVLAGFVINRTVGLPNATGDIGNWTEPIGLASLWVEALVLAVSAYGLSLSRARATAAAHAPAVDHGRAPGAVAPA